MFWGFTLQLNVHQNIFLPFRKQFFGLESRNVYEMNVKTNAMASRIKEVTLCCAINKLKLFTVYPFDIQMCE